MQITISEKDAKTLMEDFNIQLNVATDPVLSPNTCNKAGTLFITVTLLGQFIPPNIIFYVVGIFCQKMSLGKFPKGLFFSKVAQTGSVFVRKA